MQFKPNITNRHLLNQQLEHQRRKNPFEPLIRQSRQIPKTNRAENKTKTIFKTLSEFYQYFSISKILDEVKEEMSFEDKCLFTDSPSESIEAEEILNFPKELILSLLNRLELEKIMLAYDAKEKVQALVLDMNRYLVDLTELDFCDNEENINKVNQAHQCYLDTLIYYHELLLLYDGTLDNPKINKSFFKLTQIYEKALIIFQETLFSHETPKTKLKERLLENNLYPYTLAKLITQSNRIKYDYAKNNSSLIQSKTIEKLTRINSFILLTKGKAQSLGLKINDLKEENQEKSLMTNLINALYSLLIIFSTNQEAFIRSFSLYKKLTEPTSYPELE